VTNAAPLIHYLIVLNIFTYLQTSW